MTSKKSTKKTPNPTSSHEANQKKLGYTQLFDEFYDMKDFRQKPIGERAVEQIASKLRNWAVNDENALKVTQFLIDEGINWNDWKRWRARFPFLEYAYQDAMAAIGNRREIGGLKRIYDAGIVRASMSMYDKEWKETEEWRSKMKQDLEGNSTGNTIVVIEKTPDSDLVPKKPTPEEVAAKIRRKTGLTSTAGLPT